MNPYSRIRSHLHQICLVGTLSPHKSYRFAFWGMVLAFFIFSKNSVCLAGDLDSLITFLPGEKYVSAFSADGNEHRISYNKILNKGSLIGSMGGIFPLANIRYNELDAQVSLASSIYTHLNNAGIRFQVVNVDFFVDLYADVKLTSLITLRVGGGHTSHHFSDDAFESLGFTRSVNYARDYYQLFLVHQIPSLRGFAYGGTYYTHSFLIDKRIDGQWLLECGGELFTMRVYGPLQFYTAFDLKLRGELEYGSTQSYQMGMKISNISLAAIRFAYTFRTGLEERGQFYDQRNRYHTLGLFFDF